MSAVPSYKDAEDSSMMLQSCNCRFRRGWVMMLHGRAIQCYTDYHEDTEKHKALINSRGKKVFIFENHKGRITKEPKVVGDWPKGIADNEPDFHDWIQDGGGLSDGQMRLIHGEDWQPPGQV